MGEKMKKTHRHGAPLSPAIRERLRVLVDQLGEYETAALVGIGYPAVLRAVVGLGVRRGSARAIEIAVAGEIPTDQSKQHTHTT